MTNDTERAADSAPSSQQRKDFRSYVLGIGLAICLTLLPFAAVHWHLLPPLPSSVLIGVCALLQIVVHFRFFLHISFAHQREDLQLILFSTLLLVIMVAGTLWILGNLAKRMGMPGAD